MTRRMAEVSAAAEKPRKQIKRVVGWSPGLSSLSVLGDSVVSVLIVDFASVRRR